MTVLSTATRPGRLLRSGWLHPLNDTTALNALLGQFHPMWSVDAVRARIAAAVQENVDTRSLILHPNRHWPGFTAGQHAVLSVEIDGVTHQRAYSLSSRPADRHRLRLTVRRQPGGRVSGAVHERLAAGDVVTLGPPAGDFVLPAEIPPRLLMIAGGSGITPIMSQLLDLHDRRIACDVELVFCASGERGFIFGAELAALEARWPRLTIHWFDSDRAGFLDAQSLAARVPDFSARHTMLCGPAPMMARVQDIYTAHGAADRLHIERFGPAPAPSSASAGGAHQVIAGDHIFTAASDQPLLEAAEAAGLSPRYGCRMGICHSCQCRKTAGSVRNLVTGEVSDTPDELIRICVSAAVNDVRLAL